MFVHDLNEDISHELTLVMNLDHAVHGLMVELTKYGINNTKLGDCYKYILGARTKINIEKGIIEKKRKDVRDGYVSTDLSDINKGNQDVNSLLVDAEDMFRIFVKSFNTDDDKLKRYFDKIIRLIQSLFDREQEVFRRILKDIKSMQKTVKELEEELGV